MTFPDTPRLDLSERDLGLAVEDSLHALFRSMRATLPGAELVERDGYAMHHAAPTNPMFKGVWGVTLGTDRLEAAVDDAIGWFSAREAPFAFWWSGPRAAVDAGPVLEARGFEPFELGAPGQVAELGELDWQALERLPVRFVVRRVTDDAGLDTFGRALVDAFGMPDFAAQAWVDATRVVGVADAPWTFFLGELDGHPVATNMLFTGAGVATVFAIGTAAGARGRGIGAAITLAGLARARELGYRYAVLFATELGAPVYRRIGFRDAPGVAMSRWLWRPGG